MTSTPYEKSWRVDGLGGWMTIVCTSSKDDARRIARQLAQSASLLPGDVGEPREATAEDIAWFKSMCSS